MIDKKAYYTMHVSLNIYFTDGIPKPELAAYHCCVVNVAGLSVVCAFVGISIELFTRQILQVLSLPGDPENGHIL